VWVSAPIDAGFFLYEAPAGQTIASVVATKDGQPVDEDVGSPATRDVELRFALFDQRREAVRVDTPAGAAAVWTAPNKTEGRCAWAELAFQRKVISCPSAGYPFAPGQVESARLAGVPLVFGSIHAPYAAVELRLADGTWVELHPHDGFVLYAGRPDNEPVAFRIRRMNGEAILSPLSMR
jgi:hypothetical protein